MRRSKVAISWLEISLIAVLSITGMGTWLFIDQQVEIFFYDEKPDLEQFQHSARLSEKKRELAFSQNELNLNQSKLIEQRIELSSQAAKLKILKEIYPQLVADSSNQASSLPPDILKSYQQAQIDRSTAENLVNVLENRSNSLKSWVMDREDAVFKAQEASSKALTKAQNSYKWNKQKLTLFWSTGVLASITLIFFVVLSVLSRGTLNINFMTVFFGAISIQVVLLGYQAFNVIGGALAALFLLIILLIPLSRKL